MYSLCHDFCYKLRVTNHHRLTTNQNKNKEFVKNMSARLNGLLLFWKPRLARTDSMASDTEPKELDRHRLQAHVNHSIVLAVVLVAVVITAAYNIDVPLQAILPTMTDRTVFTLRLQILSAMRVVFGVFWVQTHVSTLRQWTCSPKLPNTTWLFRLVTSKTPWNSLYSALWGISS